MSGPINFSKKGDGKQRWTKGLKEVKSGSFKPMRRVI
jgi:hypothetical protein